jgi:large subunit ribosomal protein L4
MTVQKLLTYTPLDITGQTLNSEHQLNLKVLENSGNYLVHKDIIRHYVSQRQGTVSTKTRGEVRGGGRKPWKQKGTGRARAGSNSSPLWKGGGVTFGPKPKTIEYKLNKKERRLALQTLLYNKKDNILLIENLENSFEIPKTSEFSKACQNCGINLDQKILLVVSVKTESLKLSVQNIKNIELICATQLNTLSLIKAKQIILTPLALNDIKETFCG